MRNQTINTDALHQAAVAIVGQPAADLIAALYDQLAWAEARGYEQAVVDGDAEYDRGYDDGHADGYADGTEGGPAEPELNFSRAVAVGTAGINPDGTFYDIYHSRCMPDAPSEDDAYRAARALYDNGN